MKEYKNAEMPVNPVEIVREWGDGRTEKFTYTGLNKREYFTAMAMQGLLAAGKTMMIESESVFYADKLLEHLELLKQLERHKK